MASRGTARFVLIIVVLCLVATLCEGLSGRGGGSRRRRSLVRAQIAEDGAGAGSAGLVLGIIGVIGGIMLIVVVSGNSIRNNSSRNVDLDNTNASTDQPYTAATTTFDGTYNPNGTDNGVPPPSYDSTIDQKEGVPNEPNEGPPEAVCPAYPSETPYQPNPTSVRCF